METLYTYYIYEALRGDVKAFLNKIYKTQQKLIKDNKVKQVNINTGKLKKPTKPFELKDLNDKALFSFLGDNLVGTPILYNMIRNLNKYTKDGDNTLSPQCYLYFAIDGKNVFLAGDIIFDGTTYIDNFEHVLNFEVSKIVKNAPEVLKAILVDYCNLLKRGDPKKQIKGLSAKPVNPKQKANMVKLGFTSLKDDKELMTVELK